MSERSFSPEILTFLLIVVLEIRQFYIVRQFLRQNTATFEAANSKRNIKGDKKWFKGVRHLISESEKLSVEIIIRKV
jgi:hypothetical protein